jgi:hypothetical protein
VIKKFVNYFKLRGETPTNRESREKDQGLKSNWTPSDMRGVRTDTGKTGGGEGHRFPQFRRPDRGR